MRFDWEGVDPLRAKGEGEPDGFEGQGRKESIVVTCPPPEAIPPGVERNSRDKCPVDLSCQDLLRLGTGFGNTERPRDKVLFRVNDPEESETSGVTIDSGTGNSFASIDCQTDHPPRFELLREVRNKEENGPRLTEARKVWKLEVESGLLATAINRVHRLNAIDDRSAEVPLAITERVNRHDGESQAGGSKTRSPVLSSSWLRRSRNGPDGSLRPNAVQGDF